jgi:hypothetical protein
MLMLCLGIAVGVMLIVAMIGIPLMVSIALYHHVRHLCMTYIAKDPISINHEPHYWTDAIMGVVVVIVCMMALGIAYATVVAH